MTVHCQELPTALVGVRACLAATHCRQTLRQVNIIFGMVIDRLVCIENQHGHSLRDFVGVCLVGVYVFIEHVVATREAQPQQKRIC